MRCLTCGQEVTVNMERDIDYTLYIAHCCKLNVCGMNDEEAKERFKRVQEGIENMKLEQKYLKL